LHCGDRIAVVLTVGDGGTWLYEATAEGWTPAGIDPVSWVDCAPGVRVVDGVGDVRVQLEVAGSWVDSLTLSAEPDRVRLVGDHALIAPSGDELVLWIRTGDAWSESGSWGATSASIVAASRMHVVTGGRSGIVVRTRTDEGVARHDVDAVTPAALTDELLVAVTEEGPAWSGFADGTWSDWTPLPAPTGEPESYDVTALATDGTTIAVGVGRSELHRRSLGGAVHLYEFVEGAWTWVGAPRPSSLGAIPQMGSALDIAGGEVVAAELLTGAHVFSRH
jgi:hypothetical protein